MRQLFFRRPYLEELEDRNLTNMPFGQVGAPVFGLPSSSLDNADLDGSSLVALNAITKSPGDGQANNGLLNHGSAGNGHLTAIGGIDHHCCSHPYIGGSLLPGSATIMNGNAGQETTNTSENFPSLGDLGSLAAAFDSFADNSLDSVFPSAKNLSPVLPGGGDAGMSAGREISASAAPLGAGSGMSSGYAGVSGGVVGSAPGSFAMATPPHSGPMILLPSAHNSSAAISGSQKASPGSPTISPALASGPLALACSDPVCLAAQPYIPVNADDDNGSAVTNGIPAKRDFSVNPINGPNNMGDPELLSAKLWGDPTLGNGTWTVKIAPDTGPGKIALWTDQKKTAKFSPAPNQLGTMNFYIEGVHESITLNDVTLTFTYTPANGGAPPSASASITVTPLIGSFGVTVSPSPNVTFTNKGDGSSGLSAVNNFGVNSAQFKGVLDVHALKATDLAQFIQNVTGLTNGVNGTKDKNGNSVGWLYNDMTGWVAKPLQPGTPGYPLLDISSTATTQTYSNPSPYTVDMNGIGTVTDSDAPKTATPGDYNGPPGKTGIAVDYTIFFQLFLVWQYNNNGPDGKTTIYYPIALTVWSVNFYGTAGKKVPPYENPPINYIQIPNGVNSAGPNGYNATNQVPDQMVVSRATIFDRNVGWTNA